MRLESVTIDCRDKHALAGFWCALLGTTVRGEAGQYVGLHPQPDGNTRLLFQQVEDLDDSTRSRVHFDIETHDLDGDTARAESLGASVVDELEEFGMHWRVLRDPEGNLFCLVAAA
jgi:predicted enzyme related to lactoylglutathione lyase